MIRVLSHIGNREELILCKFYMLGRDTNPFVHLAPPTHPFVIISK